MNTPMMTTIARACFVGAMAFGTFAAAEYNDLVDALEAKGTLTAEEASELKAVPVKPASKFVKSLKLRGRVQAQFGYVDSENDNRSDDWSTLEMRRIRFGMRGEFPGKVRAHVEGNFIPNDVSLRAAYIQWRQHKQAYVFFGYDKPLSSFEENMSSSKIKTVERSNVNNTISAPGESTGIALSGKIAPFYYGVGIYNDQSSSRNDSNVTSEYMFNGRIGAKFEDVIGEKSSVNIGFTYSASDDPEGNVGGDYEDVYVGSLELKAGSFWLMTEYMSGENADGETTSGFTIIPAFMISDKLEAVARYEVGDSDDAQGFRASSRYSRRNPIADDGDRGDEWTSLYLGANYYFSGHGNKIMAGLEFSELKNTDAGDMENTTLYFAWRTLF